MKLKFKLLEKPYVYTRDGKSVTCRKYEIEKMPPKLYSLYLKVKEKSRTEGVVKIINIDIEDTLALAAERKRQIAFVDHKDEANNLVVAIRPGLVSEWVYAHELMHYLHPEVKELQVPTISTSNVIVDVATLNQVCRQLFDVVVDHFINRIVYHSGFDINEFFDLNLNQLDFGTETELKRIHLMKNYLVIFSMQKYLTTKDRSYSKCSDARERFRTHYLIANQLDDIIAAMESVEEFDFEAIRQLAGCFLIKDDAISPLYHFAKYGQEDLLHIT